MSSSPAELRFGTSPQNRVYGGPVSRAGPQWQQADQLIRSGQTQQVRSFVDQQVQRDRSLNGLMSAVWTLERANVPPAEMQAYRQQAFQLAQQQTRAGGRDPLPWVAVAKFSLEDQNDATFRNATQGLAQKFPNHPYSHYFQGISALKDADWKTAEQQLRKAKELGIPDESIAHWLKIAIDNQKWIWQYAWITFWVLVAWLIGLVLLYGPGRLLSGHTLRSVQREKLDPVRHGQRLVRAGYRVLINVAGVYYYLSLPLLVVLSIAVPLALGYALLHVPVISLWLIALMFLVSIGSILTAFSGLRTCFVSPDLSLSGVRVEPASHPRLWQLAQQVADRVGTRCVDEIWLVPSAELGVIERGSFLQRWRDRGTRVLILGVGLLDGFPRRAFQAVLAHEYGHFQQRDTAGGDIALRVHLAMENFAEAIAARGKIRWWHVAVHFLRFYYVLFNRLTFGASRLQEVMADRAAVLAYGATAFREGLSHAIRRSLEYDAWAMRQLRAVLRSGSPVTGLLPAGEPPSIAALDELESAYAEILRRPTAETDTHPSPRDRFAYAERLPASSDPDEGAAVWELFADPPAVQGQAQAILAGALNEQAAIWSAINDAKRAYVSQYLRQHQDPAAYETRASLHLERGDFESAFRDLDQAGQLDPSAISVRLMRAIIHRAAKAPHQAVDELARLVEEMPEAREPQVYFLLGECSVESQDVVRAESAFNDCLRLLGDARPALLARGRLRLQLGQAQRAIEDFSECVRLLPDSSDAYVDRALAHRQLGAWDAALADSEQAVSRIVSDERAQRELALVLLDKPGSTADDEQRALRHARLAAASPAAAPESCAALARACAAVGDYAAACGVIDRLLPLVEADERETWTCRRQEFASQARQSAEHGELFLATLVAEPSVGRKPWSPDHPAAQPRRLRVAWAAGAVAVCLTGVGFLAYSRGWLGGGGTPEARSAPSSVSATSLADGGTGLSAPASSGGLSSGAASKPTVGADGPRPAVAMNTASSSSPASGDSHYLRLDTIRPLNRPLEERPSSIRGLVRTPRIRLHPFTHLVSSGTEAFARLTSVPLGAGRSHTWSSDGQSVCVLFEDRLWQISLSNLVVQRELRDRNLKEIAWSSEGLLVLQESGDSLLSVLEPDTLACKKTWNLGRGGASRVIAVPDSPIVVLVRPGSSRLRIVDVSKGTMMYDFAVDQTVQGVFPGNPDAFTAPRLGLVEPGRAVLCGDGEHRLRFVLASDGLQTHANMKPMLSDSSFFCGPLVEAAADRQLAAALHLTDELAEFEDLGAPMNHSLPAITWSRRGSFIDFWKGESSQPAFSVKLPGSSTNVLFPCPADAHRWFARSADGFSLVDLLGREPAPNPDFRFGPQAAAYEPADLPRLDAPRVPEQNAQRPPNPVQIENIRLVRFESQSGAAHVDAALSRDASCAYVRRANTLYQIAVPALSVMRQVAVPDGGTLAVTSAGIIIARQDQLHVYDDDTFEHRGSYRLPAPVRFVAPHPLLPKVVFAWSDATGQEIGDARPPTRLGVVDVARKQLLLDAPTDDLGLVWKMGRDSPRDVCGLVLLPGGRLMCLAWEVNHQYVNVHQFAVADDHLAHQQFGRLPFSLADVVVPGPGDDQMTVQGRLLARGSRNQPQGVLTLTADRLTTPASIEALPSKLFAVDRSRGDYYTQGYSSDPNPTIVQRVLADGTPADAFSSSSQVPLLRTVAVLPLSTAGRMLAVGRDIVCLVDFHPALGSAVEAVGPIPAESIVQRPRFSAAAAGRLQVEYRGSLTMHPQTVSQVAFSPDGKWLASAGGTHSPRDSSIQNAFLRDAATGQIRHVLIATYGAVNSVQFSPDSNLVATADQGGRIRLWQPGSGQLVRELKAEDPVRALAWFPDGRRLAVAGGRQAEVWTIEGERSLTLAGHKANVACLAVSPDGKQIATGGQDQQLRIWDARDGAELGTYRMDPTWLTKVAFSPDGTSLAVGDWYGNLRIHNVATGEREVELRGGQNEDKRAIQAIGFSRDGRMLVTSGGRFEAEVVFWDVAGRRELGRIDPLANTVFDLALSPDERTLALACRPGVVKVFAVTAERAEE